MYICPYPFWLKHNFFYVTARALFSSLDSHSGAHPCSRDLSADGGVAPFSAFQWCQRLHATLSLCAQEDRTHAACHRSGIRVCTRIPMSCQPAYTSHSAEERSCF